ncbi:MAG: hypothetical protein H7125_00195, partial [Proteobacteria bacterium]|nr:hypothetical protein [Burkholderiales bacterium]
HAPSAQGDAGARAHAGRNAGWIYSALAAGACVRLGVVVGGMQKSGVLDELVLLAWASGAVLVTWMALRARPTRAAAF